MVKIIHKKRDTPSKPIKIVVFHEKCWVGTIIVIIFKLNIISWLARKPIHLRIHSTMSSRWSLSRSICNVEHVIFSRISYDTSSHSLRSARGTTQICWSISSQWWWNCKTWGNRRQRGLMAWVIRMILIHFLLYWNSFSEFEILNDKLYAPAINLIYAWLHLHI